MKIVIFLFLGLIIFASTNVCLFAQNREITIILLRHAEKDISLTADKSDPELSPEGKLRAEKLVEVIKKYKPDTIYATNDKRSRATVTPLAVNLYPEYRLQIQIYDDTYLDDFAAQLLKSDGKCIVVVGHNLTTPILANTLVKKDKYGGLEDNEFNKIWIFKIKKNKIKDKLITY